MLTFLSRSNAAVISAITVTCLLTVALSGCTKRRAKAPTDPGETPGKVEQKVAGSLLFEQHCAQCHGALGQGKGDAPALVGEAARSRFTTAEQLFAFVREEMPKRAPGSLEEGEYWAIVAFDLKTNGVDLDETLGPQNAARYVLHAGGDRADDKHDVARGDPAVDRVSADVSE